MAEVAKVKVIEALGKTFLGELTVGEDGAVTISNALVIEGSTVKPEHITKYIEDEYMKTLSDRRISGAGLSYCESNLSPDLRLKMMVENLIMLDAKERAQGGLIVDTYRTLKGNIGLGK